MNNDCTEDNCNVIELTNTDQQITNIYENYVLKLRIGIESTLVAAETPDNPAQYEERIVLKLGKRTYIEQQLINLQIV